MTCKWEYRVMRFGFHTRCAMDRALSDLGERGWEAIAMARIVDSEVRDIHMVLLKRPVEETDHARQR